MLVKSLVATVGALALGLFRAPRLPPGRKSSRVRGLTRHARALGQGREILPVAEEGGPLRIAVVGFVANVWRIRSGQDFAKAYAGRARDREGPEGIQGRSRSARTWPRSSARSRTISIRASTPSSSTPTPRRAGIASFHLANQKGTVLIAFDNQVDTKDMAGVGAAGPDGHGRARWRRADVGKKGGILENSRRFRLLHRQGAARRRAQRAERAGNDFEVVEVVGNWPSIRRRPPPTRSPRTATSTASSPRAVRMEPCRRLSTPSIRSCRWPARRSLFHPDRR